MEAYATVGKHAVMHRYEPFQHKEPELLVIFKNTTENIILHTSLPLSGLSPSTFSDTSWLHCAVYVQFLMVTVIGLGIVCSIVFHAGLREVHAGVEPTTTLSEPHKSMEWHDWLKEHQFYLVLVIYYIV